VSRNRQGLRRFVPGVAAMHHDAQLFNEWDETGKDAYPELEVWRFKLDLWLTCYAPGHKLWMKGALWWGYHVRRYPKPPPLDQDPVYQRLFGKDADA
jgi:hypothetical protein